VLRSAEREEERADAHTAEGQPLEGPRRTGLRITTFKILTLGRLNASGGIQCAEKWARNCKAPPLSFSLKKKKNERPVCGGKAEVILEQESWGLKRGEKEKRLHEVQVHEIGVWKRQVGMALPKITRRRTRINKLCRKRATNGVIRRRTGT